MMGHKKARSSHLRWVVVVAIAVISLSTSSVGGAVGTKPKGTSVQPSQVCGFAPPAVAIDSAIRGLGFSLTSAARSAAVERVSNLYSTLCSDTLFSNLIAQRGTSGLSLGLYGSASTGVVFANVTVNLVGRVGVAELTIQEWWSMDLRSGTIIGPLTETGPSPSVSPQSEATNRNGEVGPESHAGSNASMPDAASAAAAADSMNWAGWVLHGGSNTPTLYETWAATKVASMTTENGQQNDPPGVYPADAVAGVWVGLSPDPEGACGDYCTNLLQTGYAYDASNPSLAWCAGFPSSCNHGLFWVAANAGPTNIGPSYYSGEPTVRVGDVVSFSAFTSTPGYFTTQAFDQTTNKAWSETVSSGSWEPRYAIFILETPIDPAGPYFPQIPGFGAGSVNFEEGFLCPNSSPYCSTFPSLVNNGWYSSYYLDQTGGTANTQETISTNCVNFGGESDTCLDTSWLTSAYNFCYENPGYYVCQPHGGCVAYGTPILTPTGYVPVQKLLRGAPVDEYNFSSQSIAQGTFLSGNKTNVTHLIDINDGWLYLTPTDQPVYIRNSTFEGWLHDPQNLTASDNIFDPVTQMWVHVTSVKLIHDRTVVFDVVTSGLNNYVANGALLDRKIG